MTHVVNAKGEWHVHHQPTVDVPPFAGLVLYDSSPHVRHGIYHIGETSQYNAVQWLPGLVPGDDGVRIFGDFTRASPPVAVASALGGFKGAFSVEFWVQGFNCGFVVNGDNSPYVENIFAPQPDVVFSLLKLHVNDLPPNYRNYRWYIQVNDGTPFGYEYAKWQTANMDDGYTGSRPLAAFSDIFHLTPHHVVVVVGAMPGAPGSPENNPSYLKLYIDGVSVDLFGGWSPSDPGAVWNRAGMPLGTQIIQLPGGQTPGVSPLHDEWAFYSQQLSAGRVAAHYAARGNFGAYSAEVFADNPQAYYHMADEPYNPGYTTPAP